MADKVKIVLNRAGVRQLLKSGEMKAGLGELTAEIAGRCGDGYSSDTKDMQTRAIASVYADIKTGNGENLFDNKILKMLKG